MNVKDILNAFTFTGVSAMLTNPAMSMMGSNIHTLNQYGVEYKNYTFVQRPDLLTLLVSISSREDVDYSKYEVIIDQALAQDLIVKTPNKKRPYALTELGKNFVSMNKLHFDRMPWLAGFLART